MVAQFLAVHSRWNVFKVWYWEQALVKPSSFETILNYKNEDESRRLEGDHLLRMYSGLIRLPLNCLRASIIAGQLLKVPVEKRKKTKQSILYAVA